MDDQQIIDALRAALPEDIRQKYTDDDLLNVIDIIFDYYEDKGLIDPDTDGDDDNLDVDDLACHVLRMLGKDPGNKIEALDVPAIIEAELLAEDHLAEEI